MTEFLGFDIETTGDDEGFGLQPWRVREGRAHITMSSAWGPGMDQVELGVPSSGFIQRIRELKLRVATWNGLFDLAWMYASDVDTSGIMWYDGLLLWKWYDNGQVSPHKRDLASAAKTFLKDWEYLEEFLELKAETDEVMPDPNDPYWRHRVQLDAQATSLICDEIWKLLTPQQRRAATIQAMGLRTIAASWVNGIPVDIEQIKNAKPAITREMLEIERKLGVAEPATADGSYVPSKILRSPAKLADLVYNKWGLPCNFFTEKKKEPSANKAALTYLADWDVRAIDILRWRKLNTQWTKFISGPILACKYLGSNVTHSAPRVFGTYTGRMTYSSNSGKKNPKKIGLPIHQTPREKEIRSYVIAPEGCYIVEFDAKGQEMRGMATVSGDETMIQLFNNAPPYDNGHALTGSAIGGIAFKDFIERRKNKGDEEINGPHGLYMLGKFDNLSMGYRAGDKKLRIAAKVDYGIDADMRQIKYWKSTYLRLYPGVKRWWKDAPAKARHFGYAETLAGRRYDIVKYGKDDVWTSESSAINFPIQGMGADQRDLAIATVTSKYPALVDRFFFDLHDAMYWVIPKSWPVSFLQELLNTLDGIDYEKYWGVKLPVPFTWECSTGPTWGSKVDVDYASDGSLTLEQYYTENK